MKKHYALAAIVLLTACAKQASVTTTATAVESKPTVTLTAEDQSRGKELVARHCGNCHKPYSTDSHTAEQWAAWVPKMVRKVNGKAGSTVLTADDEALLLRYHQANGGR